MDKMKTVNVKEYEDSFVIHFGGDFRTINAYTLASTLVSLADAAKEANAIINPGYEIEIVVEALGSGSFRAKIKTVYKGLANLFSKKDLKAVVLSIIATYICQQMFPLPHEVKIDVHVDERNVTIEHKEQRVVIPKDIYDAVEEVKKSGRFKDKINSTFSAVRKNEKIETFGITKKIDDDEPDFVISRERFPVFDIIEENDSPNRAIIEVAELEILKAILERSKRKWEFVWRGIKISAPLLDDSFYQDFFDHKITIAPGDSLNVKMKIHQKRDTSTGIYTNERYEIEEVLNHIPRAMQKSFAFEEKRGRE